MKVYDSIAGIAERAQRDKSRPELVADQIAKEIISRGPARS
jgi:hypothetical protein